MWWPLLLPVQTLAGGAPLDALFVIWALQDGVDVDAGGVNAVRMELAQFDQLFDFGDDVIGGGGHHGVVVAGSLAVDEIAPAISFPGFDESEIAAESVVRGCAAGR